MNLLAIPTGVTKEDARLAWELVANIQSKAEIMRRHGLSFDEFDAKMSDPPFRLMLEEYRRHWNSDLSVNQRVALKAALLTEDSLLDVYAIVKDQEASPAQKLEAFGALAKAGEVGGQKNKAEGNLAPSVRVTINIPGRENGVTIEAVPGDFSAIEQHQ